MTRFLYLPRQDQSSDYRTIWNLDFRRVRLDNCCVARVVVEHLTRIFSGPNRESIPAVQDLNLTVEDKELVVLVGPSGCGKTTTLRLIAGLDEPSGGTIRFDGEVVNHLPPKARDVAMVFQNPALYPHLSVYENLGFGLRLRGCPKAETGRRVREAAELLGLTDTLRRRPMDLSGGQRQRVALGRALVRRPRLFLLDEPLSNLDPPSRSRMRAELWKLHAQLGTTMIYVTHDQDEALALGQHIAVLKDGVLQQVADPKTLYQHPVNTFVAGFIGSPAINFFEGTLASGGQGLVFQLLPASGSPGESGPLLPVERSSQATLGDYAGKNLLLALRPEHLLEANSHPGAVAKWCVTAHIERLESRGADLDVHLTASGRRLVARWPAVTCVKVNQPAQVVFDMRHARFFDLQTQQAIA